MVSPWVTVCRQLTQVHNLLDLENRSLIVFLLLFHSNSPVSGKFTFANDLLCELKNNPIKSGNFLVSLNIHRTKEHGGMRTESVSVTILRLLLDPLT